MWLYSLMCIAALQTDCGYADRMLTPLKPAPTYAQCLEEAKKFATEMKVGPEHWIIVCYQGVEIRA